MSEFLKKAEACKSFLVNLNALVEGLFTITKEDKYYPIKSKDTLFRGKPDYPYFDNFVLDTSKPDFLEIVQEGTVIIPIFTIERSYSESGDTIQDYKLQLPLRWLWVEDLDRVLQEYEDYLKNLLKTHNEVQLKKKAERKLKQVERDLIKLAKLKEKYEGVLQGG